MSTTVVCLHALGSSRLAFDALAAELGPEFELRALDLPVERALAAGALGRGRGRGREDQAEAREQHRDTDADGTEHREQPSERGRRGR